MIQDQRIVGFDQIEGADLVIDRIYQGGRVGNAADDPLGKLLPVENQGGFRTNGSPKRDAVKVAVLYTSGAEPDWPDVLDPHAGVFTYFGDNRSPGHLFEDTPRNGNLLLSRVFARTHGEPTDRAKVPRFYCSTSPAADATSGFAASWHLAPTGSAVKRISLPSGEQPAGKGFRITELASRC